jgi:hypothetical protein
MHGELKSWLLAAVFLVGVASAAVPAGKNTCEKQFKELQANPLYASPSAKIKVFVMHFCVREADCMRCNSLSYI